MVQHLIITKSKVMADLQYFTFISTSCHHFFYSPMSRYIPLMTSPC